VLVVQELSSEQIKIDDFTEKALKEGIKLINEMKENFKPYLKILLDNGITNQQEQVILFGLYYLQSKRDKDGYNTISKNSFLNFLNEIK
jgi:hypothetical protein